MKPNGKQGDGHAAYFKRYGMNDSSKVQGLSTWHLVFSIRSIHQLLEYSIFM